MSSSSGPLDLPIVIAEDQLEGGSFAVLSVIRPHWSRNSVTFKIFTDGITNKLLGCFHQDYADDVVLVRVYGHKTDLLIDRNAETRNIKILHEAGYAPRLYATFVNGLAYEYVPGEVLTEVTCRDPLIFPLIARMMAQMHRLKDPNAADPTEPIIWKKLKQFFDLVPDSFKDPVKQDRFRKQIPSKEQMEQEICAMKPELEALGSPVVFCHNDLLLANVIYDPSKKCVTFIDYEYSSYNYQAFDIGNHFAEFTGVGEFNSSLYPAEEFQMQWLRVYLETFQDREVSDKEVYNLYVKVNKFSPVSRFFWMLWALIQAEHSNIEFDFVGYAVNLWKEYRTRKEQFQSLALKDV